MTKKITAMQTIKRFIHLAIAGNLILYSFFVFVPTSQADELIDSGAIKNQIQQDVNSQTSAINANTTVNADTSSAPAPDFKPQVNVDMGGGGGTSTTAGSDVVNSGDNVDVNTQAKSKTDVAVTTNSNADINQHVGAVADTGNNEASRNIAIGGGNAGVIVTGNATVNTTQAVNANNGTTTVLGGVGGGAGAGSNVTNTGTSLTTITNANSTTQIMVTNNSTAIIGQTTNAYANTGGNTADRNIAIGGGMAGVILTGDATINADFLVTANGSVVLIGGENNGNDGPGSGASIILTNTGDNSKFNTKARTRRYVVVNNYNRARIEQSCGYDLGPQDYLADVSGCSAITGYNNADGNIAVDGGSAGVVETSDAVVNVFMHADANNTKSFVDASGSGGAQAGASVVNTGDDVDVNTKAKSKTDVEVNTKNDAKVDQYVGAVAITGRNSSSRNIAIGGGDAGVIHTGNATVDVTMVADVNNTETVIDLGGGAFGGPAALSNGTGGTGAGSQVINTGDNNTFTTESKTEVDIDVNNESFLDLVQRFFGRAVSGLNRAAKNIGAGAGFIRTGAAVINVNQEAKGNDHCTLVGFGALALDACDDPGNPAGPGPQEETPDETSDATPPSGGPDDDFNPEELAVFSGTSKKSDDDDEDDDDGDVLGAASLPSTGAQWTLFILGVSALGLLAGRNLRKYTNAQAIRNAVSN